MSLEPPVDPALEAPIEANRYAWPSATLDPVARLRALAAARPHLAIDETVFDVSFERFWPFVADLEGSTPRYEGLVARAQILERRPAAATRAHADDGRAAVGAGAEPEAAGERLVIETRGPLPGPPMKFDVVLRPGWCLMRSSLGEVGMAAAPEGPDRTRFVHFEGSARLGRLLRPFFAWNIRQDFRRLRRLLGDMG